LDNLTVKLDGSSGLLSIAIGVHYIELPMPRATSNPKGARISPTKSHVANRRSPTKGEKGGDDNLSNAMAGVLYLTTHSEKPEVQALAKRAKINLSGFSGPVGPSFDEFSDAIKALVSMGLDTDDNLKLMFGNAKSVRNLQQEFRMGVLFGESSEEGSCSSNRTDPDKPASEAITRLLPLWQRALTNSEKDDYCSICQEKLSSPAQAIHGCMHLFHLKCIADWLADKSTCPVCRKALPLHAPRPASTKELELIDQISSIK
jgi:hypothetical protein